MKVQVTNLYENRTDVTLTSYIIDDSEVLLNGRKRPAVIICPGGAYLDLSDKEAEPVALKFLSMGYHAFVLRYSVYGEGKQNMGELCMQKLTPKEQTQYPNAIREIAKSFIILNEKADEWFIDTDKIALCGFSAGGHNVALYGTKWHTEIITDYFKKDKEILKPVAIIAGYPRLDYLYERDTYNSKKPFGKALCDASSVSLLGEEFPSEEKLLEVSPSQNITENTPPMFIWSTTEDGLVPVMHSVKFANSLAENNIPFELHIFETGDHGLSLATKVSASAMSETNKNASKWTELAENWLKLRLDLELPEKTEWQIKMGL